MPLNGRRYRCDSTGVAFFSHWIVISSSLWKYGRWFQTGHIQKKSGNGFPYQGTPCCQLTCIQNFYYVEWMVLHEFRALQTFESMIRVAVGSVHVAPKGDTKPHAKADHAMLDFLYRCPGKVMSQFLTVIEKGTCSWGVVKIPWNKADAAYHIRHQVVGWSWGTNKWLYHPDQNIVVEMNIADWYRLIEMERRTRQSVMRFLIFEIARIGSR